MPKLKIFLLFGNLFVIISVYFVIVVKYPILSYKKRH